MKWFYSAALSAFLVMAPAVYAAPVDINTADAKTLDKTIAGVGPKLAQAIVDYRAKNGPFRSVDELTKIKGLGKATVDKNRTNLTAGQPVSK